MLQSEPSKCVISRLFVKGILIGILEIDRAFKGNNTDMQNQKINLYKIKEHANFVINFIQ